MRATSIGHAGILDRDAAGSILCDPWFVPAFFGSWFVFPRNDQLPTELLERRSSTPTTSTSRTSTPTTSTSAFLADHIAARPPCCCPATRPRAGARTAAPRVRPLHPHRATASRVELADGLTIAIHVETSITDGPGGDSALVVGDGEARLVDQNDCRTTTSPR